MYKRQLSDYGIATPRLEVAEEQDGVLAAAGRIGFPIALKTAAASIRHKSDVAGVVLGLADVTALTTTYADMAARLGGRVIVAAMAEKGTEIAFGLVHDPQFGPFVMIAAGGIWIEALNDRTVSLAPVTVEAAHDMISGLRISRLLEGGRGQKPADRDALALAFARFSMIAADLGDLIDEMDVNPLFVGPGGCCAVDALLIARTHPIAAKTR